MKYATLWILFKAGSDAAFSALYHEHFKNLVKYGRKLTSDKSLIEDAIQDLFLDLWIRRESLSSVSCVKFYLLKCLRRRIIKIISKNPYAELKAEDHGNQRSRDNDNLQADEETHHRTLKLTKSLGKLTRRQQVAIHLKFYGGLTTEQLANTLSLSPKSASNLISKSLIAMRSQLKPNLDTVWSHPEMEKIAV